MAAMQGEMVTFASDGGTASAPPMLFVPCRNELDALRIEGSSFSVAWRVSGVDGSPCKSASRSTIWMTPLEAGP